MATEFPLTIGDIKDICGTTFFKRGQAYVHEGRVAKIGYDPSGWSYSAVVKGSRQYKVTIDIHEDGEVEADCSCPAAHSYYNYYCKHVAAVLIQVQSLESNGKIKREAAPQPDRISNESLRMTDSLIQLFDSAAVSPKSAGTGTGAETLMLEFICSFNYSFGRKPSFQIEMKVGQKRLYVVQKLKTFLGHIVRGESYAFTKLFSYEPSLHRFADRDLAVIRMLADACRSEEEYRELLLNSYYYGSSASNERYMSIPPSLWDRMMPLLLEAGATIEHEGRSLELQVKDEPLPVSFELSEHNAGSCKLSVQGLEKIRMFDQYGLAQVDGTLYKMDEAQLSRIASLKSVLAAAPKHQPVIAAGQMDAFMERVMPKLKGIGPVKLSSAVAERVVHAPLLAKLYADYSDGKLQLRVEYTYDSIIIDPLRQGSGGEREASNRIVMREADKEREIMSLIEAGDFKFNGKELYTTDEGHMVHFLYRLLPELERLAEVYATPAVKSLVLPKSYSPRAAADVDGSMNWLEIKFDMDGIDKSEIRGLLHTLMEKKKYHRLPSGAFVHLEQEGFEEIGRMFEQLGIRKSDLKNDTVKLPVYRGFQMLETADAGNKLKLGKSLRRLLDNMRNPDNLEFAVPERLVPILRDYQTFGFHWFKTLSHYRFGGILADDMGLGKTLQSIAFIASEKLQDREQGKQAGQASASAPVLVVCPASLIYNWENEFAKFAPELNVMVAAGGKDVRSGMLADSQGVDVLVTSYPLLRRDAEWYESQSFHTLILDEAQAIKNHLSQTSQVVKRITADRKFALTGTPIENSLDELWSILEAVFPDLFAGKKSFQDMPREKAARLLRPFLLRRMKSDVLKELPEKIESVHRSELQEEQKKVYAAYLAKLQEETLQDLEGDGFQKSRMKILAGITRLRQLCCHPSLFLDNYEGSSGKLEQLMELIEDARESGRRLLVFSQFTSMLQMIRAELQARRTEVFYLDGSTPAAERVKMCERFNGGERDLFLISLKAGGTGLNLTGADTVVLFDLWWNPAVEQQAADRAHRMGQKNVVQVYRLVAKGTIEEKILELQERKKNLIEEMIQPGEAAVSSLSESDIRELLMIG